MKKNFHYIDYLVLLLVCCKEELSESSSDRDSTLQATAVFSDPNAVNVAKTKVCKLLLFNFIKAGNISIQIFSKATQELRIIINLIYSQLEHYRCGNSIEFNTKTKLKSPKFKNQYFQCAKINYILSRNQNSIS